MVQIETGDEARSRGGTVCATGRPVVMYRGGGTFLESETAGSAGGEYNDQDDSQRLRCGATVRCVMMHRDKASAL